METAGSGVWIANWPFHYHQPNASVMAAASPSLRRPGPVPMPSNGAGGISGASERFINLSLSRNTLREQKLGSSNAVRWSFQMCDYSLANVLSRPAVVRDNLITTG